MPSSRLIDLIEVPSAKRSSLAFLWPSQFSLILSFQLSRSLGCHTHIHLLVLQLGLPACSPIKFYFYPQMPNVFKDQSSVSRQSTPLTSFPKEWCPKCLGIWLPCLMLFIAIRAGGWNFYISAAIAFTLYSLITDLSLITYHLLFTCHLTYHWHVTDSRLMQLRNYDYNCGFFHYD